MDRNLVGGDLGQVRVSMLGLPGCVGGTADGWLRGTSGLPGFMGGMADGWLGGTSGLPGCAGGMADGWLRGTSGVVETSPAVTARGTTGI